MTQVHAPGRAIALAAIHTRERRLAADRAVAALNEAMRLEPEAMTRLLSTRFYAPAIADHPTVRVAPDRTLGAMGLLCGVLDAALGEPILLETDINGRPTRFVLQASLIAFSLEDGPVFDREAVRDTQRRKATDF